MAIPTLPGPNSNDWYAHYTALDGAARTAMAVVGSTTTPITSATTARPDAPAVYWICATGVTPTNAVNGDLIYNT